MANTGFEGSITTSGTSQAIRVEKAFFRSFPEFQQKAKIRANVISRGRVLISLVDEANTEEAENDPVVEAFLGFLAEDMQTCPQRMVPLSEAVIDRVEKLTRDVFVDVDNEETLPDDITF